MPSPFQSSGAQIKPSRYAPLFTRRFKVGLFTNGNPLGDPVTPYIYERAYGATSFDYLLDGLNMEITSALTLVRRPGHSVFNSQTFPPIDNFFEFRTFTTNTERIYVMASAASAVFDATGPSTKNTVFTKGGGTGKTYFQDVGNVLYFCDGLNLKKWHPALSSFKTFPFLVGPSPIGWVGLQPFGVDNLFIDANGNLQVVITAGTSGASLPTWNVTPFGTTTDGSVVWRNHGPNVSNWGVVGPAAAPTVLPPTSPNIFAVRFWAPSHSYSATGTGVYCILDSNGNLQVLVDGTKTTGSSYPNWNTNFGGTTLDGTGSWVNHGQMISVTQGYKNSAVYLAGATLIDTAGNIQCTFTGGTTAAGPGMPAFSAVVAGTVADGTVTWTCLGSGLVQAGGVGGQGAISIVVTTGAPSGGGGIPSTTTSVTTSAAAPPTTAPPRGYVYYSAFFAAGGQFSNLSPPSLATGPVFGATYSAIVSGAGSSDPQVVKNVAFRTVDGGVTPFGKVSDNSAIENANVTWTLTDTTADRLLDTTIIGETALRNSPPPAGLINLTFHLGRIWGSVGNVVYVSNPANLTIGIGWESWQPLSSYTHPSQVIRVEPNALGMLVFTLSDVYIIPINSQTGALAINSVPYIKGTGMLNWNAFAINGSLMYILSTSGNLLQLDPSSGVTFVGHPIANLLKSFPRASSYLAWHEDGEDIGLHVFDGTSQRYRLSSTASPESGNPPWSVLCSLASSAVMSIEVSPGVTKLLVGPASSGPILQRDSSVNKDNGAAFTCRATIGTLVLAQPGQLAEVSFITTICRKLGAHPVLGLLTDEISGTFKTLVSNTQDSPFKFASTTLMMDRFNTNQLNEPAKMMFMQLQISFPAEDFKNEVLAYSIFGTHYQEG